MNGREHAWYRYTVSLPQVPQYRREFPPSGLGYGLPLGSIAYRTFKVEYLLAASLVDAKANSGSQKAPREWQDPLRPRTHHFTTFGTVAE